MKVIKQLNIKVNSNFAKSVDMDYLKSKVNVYFARPNPQLNPVDISDFCVTTEYTYTNDTIFVYFDTDKVDKSIIDYITETNGLVANLIVKRNNEGKLHLDHINIINENNVDYILLEWYELDPLENVQQRCTECFRTLRLSLHEPLAECKCGEIYKLKSIISPFYGKGYTTNRLSKERQ